MSVNPYQIIPGIYELPMVHSYVSKRLGSMPPQVFAVADDAFSAMVEWKRNQSMIIRFV